MVSTRGVKFKYTEGERVLCYEPDPTKAKVLYESKVLDLVVTRDSKGRKSAEYRVHFYGWNSSWDRCVHEDFILSDTEENRILQKRLAEEASINLKGKKRLHKMGALLKDSFHKRKCLDGSKENGNSSKEGSKWQESDTSQEEESSADETDEYDTEDEEEDDSSNPYMELVLSDKIKEILEDDCLNITSQNKLLKLPAEPSIMDILENYAKQYGVSLICPSPGSEKQKHHNLHRDHIRTQNQIRLCKEMADGLRVCFDFTLPLVLLYKQEKQQYKEIISRPFEVKPREPSSMHNFIISQTPSATQSMDLPRPEEVPPVRTRERLPSASPNHSPTITFQHKSENTPPHNETENNTTSNRTRSRICRENQSPPSSSGDESHQKMHRVLRSTERLRLEEDCIIKSEPNAEMELVSCPDSPTISFKNLPPCSPPLPTEAPTSSASSKGEGSSACSSHSDSTVEQPTSDAKEVIPDAKGLLNDLMNWQLLPPHLCLNHNKPTPPSFVYGAHHLLRLFVKLPEYLNEMSIPKSKRGLLIKHLKAFLHYIDEKCDSLLSPSAYVDVNDNI